MVPLLGMPDGRSCHFPWPRAKCHSTYLRFTWARYDYVNITIRDTVVLDAHGGLNVQTRGPGSVRGLTVTNLVVSHAIFDAPCKPWMGNAQPVAISADRWCGGPAPCDENGGPPAGTITVRLSSGHTHVLTTWLSPSARLTTWLWMAQRMSCWKTSPASRRMAYSFQAG